MAMGLSKQATKISKRLRVSIPLAFQIYAKPRFNRSHLLQLIRARSKTPKEEAFKRFRAGRSRAESLRGCVGQRERRDRARVLLAEVQALQLSAQLRLGG